MTKKSNKTEETTELATTSNAPVALAAASAFDDFGEGETLTKRDLLIKRYRIVQGMTRAKKENKNLRDGDIYDTLTKEGFGTCVVLPIYEEEVVVEKVDDSTAKFVRQMPLNDPRVVSALKANNYEWKGLKSVDCDPPTKLVNTFNVHVVFLEKDEVPTVEFGVLQFDSTNHIPRSQWKNDRVQAAANLHQQKVISKPSLASFFFPSVVTTTDKHNAASGTDSKIYKITPRGERWTDILNPAVPSDKQLLDACKAHLELLKSGLFSVDYSGEDEEAGQTEGYVNPDDDGRDPVAANEAPGF